MYIPIEPVGGSGGGAEEGCGGWGVRPQSGPLAGHGAAPCRGAPLLEKKMDPHTPTLFKQLDYTRVIIQSGQ